MDQLTFNHQSNWTILDLLILANTSITMIAPEQTRSSLNSSNFIGFVVLCNTIKTTDKEDMITPNSQF